MHPGMGMYEIAQGESSDFAFVYFGVKFLGGRKKRHFVARTEGYHSEAPRISR
jgi:hypothetical protein